MGNAPRIDYEQKKRDDAETRKKQRAAQERGKRLSELEARIAEREVSVKALEAQMADSAFYTDRAAAEDVISRHQKLMWEVGDLMNQWEALQAEESRATGHK